jgi:probable H4MPT-linked C1 transfer pathway protein
MATTILGLDIGGANLKAATPDKRAVSIPFPLWKQPDRLPAALAELVKQFPDADELAVTMTGELCDCFETKREGVAGIIKAVRFASAARPIHVWSTDGTFLNSEEAKQDHMKVAAANWHALATFAGRYAPEGRAILVDVGSTTTDVIPILDGAPVPKGKTDQERFRTSELIYVGARRTPICALLGSLVFAEVFATTHDAYLLLGKIPESPQDCDTADGRASTQAHAHARMARMVGGDATTVSLDRVASLAADARNRHLEYMKYSVTAALTRLSDLRRPPLPPGPLRYILSGSGEFVAREFVLANRFDTNQVDSLADALGDTFSACAPAYAVAVLAAERRP